MIMNVKGFNRFVYLLAVILLTLVLTGCVKARIAINVEPNGSGTLGIAIGMTQQAMSLAGNDSEGVMQRLSQEMPTEEQQEGVTVSRWTEGEYEWVETNTLFADLNDLNSRMKETDLFENFSLTCQQTLLKNRFVLDAKLIPLLDNEELPQDLFLDPSGMFEFQVSIHLPGDVIETNGIFDRDSSMMIWTINNYESLEMYAVSETWNWFRVGVLAVVAIMGISGAGVISMALYRTSSKKGKLSLDAVATDDLLQKGIDILNAGRKAEARRLLTQVVQQDESNEMAWLWLSGAVDTDEERLTCLENVLAINPNSSIAQQGIAKFRKPSQRFGSASDVVPRGNEIILRPFEETSTDKTKDTIRQAVAAIKSGEKDRGKQLLIKVIDQDEENG